MCIRDRYKLAQILHVTIEDLIIDSIKGVEPPQSTISFELFKSNICHRIKDSGDIAFIIETLKSNEIRQYYCLLYTSIQCFTSGNLT